MNNVSTPHDAPRFGHRHEIVHNVQGSPFNQDTPLAAEDFLNPEPGDVFYHGERHDATVDRLLRSLAQLLRTRANLTVLSQVKLRLPAPARFHPMPDLLIVENLSAPNRPRATLDLAQESATIRAVIEVTSPLFAHFDLDTKPAIYHAAGIPTYVVLDTGLRPDEATPRPQIVAWHSAGPHAEGPPAHPGTEGAERYALPGLDVTLMLDGGNFSVLDPTTEAPIQIAPEQTTPLSDTQAEGRFRAQSIASQLKL